MSRFSDNPEDPVRERSGWIIPIGVFLVTATLSAAILLYYLAPTPATLIEQHPVPTTRTDPVRLSIGSLDLVIPANYMLYGKERQGGPQSKAELYTLYPTFGGYTDTHAWLFNDSNADSPVIYILIRQEDFDIDETARLQRIYMNYVVNPVGAPGPFGLVQFTFRDDSGYRGEDLFVGQLGSDTIVMHCVRPSQDAASPSCLRDVRLARGVALSYRFKRAQLSHWREIAQGIDTLIRSFSSRTK